MLNARLLRKDHKHSRFYEMTEPFFERMNDGLPECVDRLYEGTLYGLGNCIDFDIPYLAYYSPTAK
jgi:hypothetical protein